jgi:DAK2 domain fusion protein YloV
VNDVDRVREIARTALAALERSRSRIDDLNVYPVPDGDTGTNLTLTGRAIVDDLEASTASDRAAITREVTRSALMGARGNSGVIFSQIVRGAAEVLGATEEGEIDERTLARAFRAASDAAYRAVRKPVEGTMLSAIRALAEEAEDRGEEGLGVDRFLAELIRRGEDAVARTQEQLDVLREAGVVDAGAAGLLEIVRGIAAGVAHEELPEAPVETEELAAEAIHKELSRFRYCTTFVIEGEGLDTDSIEAELDRLGDSLLVVGDQSALKVHVHTDEPGRALSIGTAVGVIDRIEIANMHEQTVEREVRLLEAVPAAEPPVRERGPGEGVWGNREVPPASIEAATTAVVAVVAGTGNRRLFESLGAAQIVEGGQTMNPSTADVVAAIEAAPADEVIVLPNNSNVILAAEQAVGQTEKHVEVVPTDSIPAGLAAMVVFDADSDAADNAAEMRDVLESVATGEVTVASRDAELNGLRISAGAYLGLADGEAVAEGADFDEVAAAVAERLLAEPRGVLTLLTGEDEPDLAQLLERLGAEHPEVELEVQQGGQPHYPLLLGAE